jgi:hypothetical protein
MSDKPKERFSGAYSLKYSKSIMRGSLPVSFFDFTNDPYDPLTFHAHDGRQYRPASSFSEFDFGSVPRITQSIVSPLCATRSFVFHDSSFLNHGMWVSYDGGSIWSFLPLSQHEVNHWLYRMMNVEGNPEARCWAAFEGVQIGGSDMWKSHVGPFPINPGYPVTNLVSGSLVLVQ